MRDVVGAPFRMRPVALAALTFVRSLELAARLRAAADEATEAA